MKTTHQGRAPYEPIIPKGEFTFAELAEANGVDMKTGKGEKCSALTLRKWVGRELGRRNKSAIVHLQNAEVNGNTDGRGRRAYVYARREEVQGSPRTLPATRQNKTFAPFEGQTAFLLGSETVDLIQRLVGNDSEKIGRIAAIIAPAVRTMEGNPSIIIMDQFPHKAGKKAEVQQTVAQPASVETQEKVKAPALYNAQGQLVGQLVAA